MSTRIETLRLKCLRCGNEWVPIIDHPKRCPNCNSPYWNKPRIPRTVDELIIFMREHGVELEVDDDKIG